MKIWVDVENLPDVPFFHPILGALRTGGHEIIITARHEKDLPELCARKGWQIVRTTGRHAGPGRIGKIATGLLRSAALAATMAGRRADLLVNFASRPAILAAGALRVPVFTFFDYEHVALPLVGRISRIVCVPDAIPEDRLPQLGIPRAKVLSLPGTKEDVYAHDFVPSDLRQDLGIPSEAPFAVIRPPARSAHYHDRRSEALYDALLERLASDKAVHARVLVRTSEEGEALGARFRGEGRIRPMAATRDGLNLIWNADLVVSGGGTMTREAAALGVPSYSVFTGTTGAVDQRLFESGRVVHVRDAGDAARIRFVRAPRRNAPPAPRLDLIDLLVRGILGAAH